MASSKSPKKNIDKDYIFNLIMPSGPAPADEEPQEAEVQQQPLEPVEAPARDSLSLLQERINQAPSAAVKLRPAKELVLVNLMEQLVAARLDEAFSKFNCCRCDKCRRDVAAMALNSLAPNYVVAEPDAVPQLLQECSTKDVSAALVKAILYVKGHPKH